MNRIDSRRTQLPTDSTLSNPSVTVGTYVKRHPARMLSVVVFTVLLFSTLRMMSLSMSSFAWPDSFNQREGPEFDDDRICQLHDSQVVFQPVSHNAFAVVTQETLPRMYHLGFESFLKHNSDTTLHIYGNIDQIDPRFAAHDYRIQIVPLNITDIQRQLVDVVPELDQAVFQTHTWKTQILPSILRTPMILSDFLRNSLLFLHGGSWLDADAIYLRPFTMRSGLPCHQRITDGPRILCDADDRLHQPFNESLPIVPGRTFYCTNGIMGQFRARHPFLRKALLSMALVYPDLDQHPGLEFVALGGHLFVAVMIGHPRASRQLDVSEWPRMYNITQMFGFWDLYEFEASHENKVAAMVADLERRRVYSVQLYHGILGAPHPLHQELWRRNCVFSCNESLG